MPCFSRCLALTFWHMVLQERGVCSGKEAVIDNLIYRNSLEGPYKLDGAVSAQLNSFVSKKLLFCPEK